MWNSTQEWMTTQYEQASDTYMANRLHMRGNPTAHRTQPSLLASQTLGSARDNQDSGSGKPIFSLQSLRCTSQDMRSEKHCTSPSFVRTTHESQILGQPGQSSTTSIESSKVKNPNPMLHLIQTISPCYTPLPGVMTALALRISLILVVEFHAVCRCTICGAQVDSEARIPGITMTVRVDIFTKTVTSNPQTNQPKFPNQLCDSHPDLDEHTTNGHLIPSLTTITDDVKDVY